MKSTGTLKESWPFTAVLLAAVIVSFFLWKPLAVLFLLLTLFNLYFFRDPEREISSDGKAIVAAADGLIVEIKEVEEPYYCKSKAQMVAIFLSVFDVHVQRAPCQGEIELTKHFPGKFFDVRRPEASGQNEHRVIGIRDGEFKMVVRQIAGLIARRIVGWRGEGERVEKGERIGMIRYGSRVEMFLPLDTQIAVKVGQRAKGGETIIGWRK